MRANRSANAFSSLLSRRTWRVGDTTRSGLIEFRTIGSPRRQNNVSISPRTNTRRSSRERARVHAYLHTCEIFLCICTRMCVCIRARVLSERAALCGIVKQRQPCKSVPECGSSDRFSPCSLSPPLAIPSCPPPSVPTASFAIARHPSSHRRHLLRRTVSRNEVVANGSDLRGKIAPVSWCRDLNAANLSPGPGYRRRRCRRKSELPLLSFRIGFVMNFGDESDDIRPRERMAICKSNLSFVTAMTCPFDPLRCHSDLFLARPVDLRALSFSPPLPPHRFSLPLSVSSFNAELVRFIDRAAESPRSPDYARDQRGKLEMHLSPASAHATAAATDGSRSSSSSLDSPRLRFNMPL